MCYILPETSCTRKRATTKLYADVILHLAGEGHSIREIGYGLFLAEPTVIMCLHEIVATMPESETRAVKALVDGLESEATK